MKLDMKTMQWLYFSRCDTDKHKVSIIIAYRRNFNVIFICFIMWHTKAACFDKDIVLFNAIFSTHVIQLSIMFLLPRTCCVIRLMPLPCTYMKFNTVGLGDISNYRQQTTTKKLRSAKLTCFSFFGFTESASEN